MPVTKCTFTAEDTCTQSVLSAILESKGMILICGAGISVAAGIPDFRSKHEIIGVPELSRRKLKDMFRLSMITGDTERPLFARFVAGIAQKAEESQPTAFHKLLKKLDERESLVRVYTQNIDGLELRAGLSTYHRSQGDDTTASPRCIPVHGSLQYLYCVCCHSVEQEKQHREKLKDGDFPACSHCEMAQRARRAAGKRELKIPRMIPDVVLYEQEHPDGQQIADFVVEDLSRKPKIDLLLVVGTGMHVKGAAEMIRDFSRLVRKNLTAVYPCAIYLNLDFKQQRKWESTFDMWVQADCQVVANAVLDALERENVKGVRPRSVSAFDINETNNILEPVEGIQRSDATNAWSREDLMANCRILVEFHIERALDVVRGDPELVDAVHYLKCAMKMASEGADLALAEFHLKRVGTLRVGDGELGWRLDLVRACIDFMRTIL